MRRVNSRGVVVVVVLLGVLASNAWAMKRPDDAAAFVIDQPAKKAFKGVVGVMQALEYEVSAKKKPTYVEASHATMLVTHVMMSPQGNQAAGLVTILTAHVWLEQQPAGSTRVSVFVTCRRREHPEGETRDCGRDTSAEEKIGEELQKKLRARVAAPTAEDADAPSPAADPPAARRPQG